MEVSPLPINVKSYSQIMHSHLCPTMAAKLASFRMDNRCHGPQPASLVRAQSLLTIDGVLTHTQ